MTIKEVNLTEPIAKQLISLSEDWEDEVGMEFWTADLFKKI